MKKIFFLFAAILITNSFLSAQKGNDKVELQLTLRDGSIMKGTTKMNNVELKTDYGKLDIPIKNVSSIEFGIVENPSLKDKVANLVKQLSDPNEDTRKNAYQQIIALGVQAIPTLKNYIYSDKYEAGAYADFTADAALKELQIMNNVNDSSSDKDVVTIDFIYVMGGIYNLPNVNLQTEYGALTIPREKIKKMDVYYSEGGEGAQKTFVLMANKNISGNANGGWLHTGINIKPGQKIDINATGEVYLASLAASYKPDGTYVNSTNYNYGTEGETNYNTNSAYSYPTYGSVVYKIGSNETALKAGSKFTGTANNGGMLYLAIYETVFNASNTGSYTVKIKIH
ncbi:MAG: hypothetical protein HY958_13015 [Bacteroidia bacterium]|nr:hypothetical protein [Bacteroidia bacterium]